MVGDIANIELLHLLFCSRLTFLVSALYCGSIEYNMTSTDPPSKSSVITLSGSCDFKVAVSVWLFG